MITWIQVLLQKHHKIIFSVLLFVIIIAFVFTIGSSIPFFGGRDGSARVSRANFYGYNLDDPNQIATLRYQAVLDLNLAGARADGNSVFSKIILSAYLQHVARQMRINRVSGEELEKFITSLPAFQKDGSFDAEAWKDFSRNFTQGMNLTDKQFADMLERIAVENKVQNLIAGPGYATEAEVEDSYCLQNGVWNLCAASLNYASFDPKTKFTDEDLQKFFDANKEIFRVPAAMGFDVVFFAAKDFPPAAEENFTGEEIEKFYKQTIRKYLARDEKGVKIKDLKDVKDDVIKDLKNESAIKRALVKADGVIDAICESNAGFASGEFKGILEDENLSVKSLPLLLPGEKAPDGTPREVVARAFEAKLTPETFYCDPIRTDDGAYLVFLRESKPSYIPQMGEVRAQVERAYLESKKREAFAALGSELSEKLRAEAAKGGEKVFAQTAKNSGFEVQNIEKFIFSNSAVSDAALYRALDSVLPKMSGGDVSDMHIVGGTGYIVYVKSFEKPNLNGDAADLKTLASQMAANFARYSEIGILNAKIGEQLPKKLNGAE
ncbi:MAG: peptidyl-prolyl cis-trans isomerase [Opitutales bacterium]|nr:peptidyl-prolyl cis-trans isomerase [Opitutales bacterium]